MLKFPPHSSFHLCWVFIGKGCGRCREVLQGNRSIKYTAADNKGLTQRCTITHEFLPQADLGSHAMPLFLVICAFPAECLGITPPQLGRLNQTSGHLTLRLAGSPFIISHFPAVSDTSLSKVRSGIRMRWLIFGIETDEFSKTHIYSLHCLWAQLFIHLHKHLWHTASPVLCRGMLGFLFSHLFREAPLNNPGHIFQAAGTAARSVAPSPGESVAISVNVHFPHIIYNI